MNKKNTITLEQKWSLAFCMVALWGAMGLLLGEGLAAWVPPFIGGVLIASFLILGHRWVRFDFSLKIPPFLRLIEPLVIILCLVIWARGLWAARLDQLPPLWSYAPFSFLWVWLLFGVLWSGLSRPAQWVVRLALQGVVSLVIIVVMLEILLRLFAARLPDSLLERAPLLEGAAKDRNPHAVIMPPQAPVKDYYWAGVTSDYTLYNTDGDLYRVSCLEPPIHREPLYDIRITYNQWGFRETTSGVADLVVLGDSFTFAAWNPDPYWLGIAPKTVAFAAPGSGSLEQAYLAEAFAAERQPKVMVMAFFEGNDLQDSWRFAQAVHDYENQVAPRSGWREQYPHFRPLRLLSTYSTALWLIDEIGVLEEATYGVCPYPLTDTYGNELAFYDNYVAMGTVPTDELRQSPLWATTADAIRRTAAYAKSIGAEFVLMFIPDKFHVHYEGLSADQLAAVGEDVPAFQITAAGFEPDVSVSSDEVLARLAAHRDNQRTLLRELAEAEDFLFLDLLPPLQRAAAEGQPAYAFNDTHFSNEGHLLVRAILQDFLNQHDLLGEKSD